MTESFEGRVALVTGAGSGIGRATALRFAKAGARVVVSDVSVDTGQECAGAIRASGAESLFVRADVRSSADVAALVDAAVKRFGRIDCAFNNAGIEGALTPTADYPEDDFMRVLDVNLAGVWRSMRAEIPVMLRQKRGAIVNTASVAGLVGAGGLSAYVASKHGVVGLTRAAAIDYGAAGIRVNAVCPGVIQTPMLERLAKQAEGLIDALVATKPLGRLGAPEEIAEAVLWLCSDAAGFVTGHALAVDGGYVAR